jgi:CRP/FNR family cyclic AMP-dependent transcriptional regulator
MARDTETLARVPFFRSLDRAAIKALDARCTWRRVREKDWIIDYQDEGIDVFFVTGGVVRVLIYAKSGREVILADLGAGGFFGELAAIDGKPRSAGVLAVTDAVMASMPGAVFMEMLRMHPEVCMQVLKLLAARVRALDNRVLEYSSLNVRQRIHAELLRLSRPDPGDNNRAIVSPPPIHADIAARVSTHREAVAREMKRLERLELLQRRRGALVITDVPSLMQQLERPS